MLATESEIPAGEVSFPKMNIGLFPSLSKSLKSAREWSVCRKARDVL